MLLLTLHFRVRLCCSSFHSSPQCFVIAQVQHVLSLGCHVTPSHRLLIQVVTIQLNPYSSCSTFMCSHYFPPFRMTYHKLLFFHVSPFLVRSAALCNCVRNINSSSVQVNLCAHTNPILSNRCESQLASSVSELSFTPVAHANAIDAFTCKEVFLN